MATPLEIVDIVNRIVQDLSGDDKTLTSTTKSLFETLNANEKTQVQAQARQELAQVQGDISSRRLQVQQEGQLRRDALKADTGLRTLEQKTRVNLAQKTTPTFAQTTRLRDRSRKIRLADARKGIRLAQRGGSVREVLASIKLLKEVDPDAARSLRADFMRDPTGGTVRVRAGAVGTRGAPIESAVFEKGRGQVSPGRELAKPFTSTLKLEPSEAAFARGEKSILQAKPGYKLRKLGKAGLIGGAGAIGIQLLLKMFGGGQKDAVSEIPPEIQMQLMQSLGGGRGGVDPAIGTGRDLRNVFKLLQIIKTLTDMQGVQSQPGMGALV